MDRSYIYHITADLKNPPHNQLIEASEYIESPTLEGAMTLFEAHISPKWVFHYHGIVEHCSCLHP